MPPPYFPIFPIFHIVQPHELTFVTFPRIVPDVIWYQVFVEMVLIVAMVAAFSMPSICCFCN